MGLYLLLITSTIVLILSLLWFKRDKGFESAISIITSLSILSTTMLGLLDVESNKKDTNNERPNKEASSQSREKEIIPDCDSSSFSLVTNNLDLPESIRLSVNNNGVFTVTKKNKHLFTETIDTLYHGALNKVNGFRFFKTLSEQNTPIIIQYRNGQNAIFYTSKYFDFDDFNVYVQCRLKKYNKNIFIERKSISLFAFLGFIVYPSWFIYAIYFCYKFYYTRDFNTASFFKWVLIYGALMIFLRTDKDALSMIAVF